MSVNDFSKKITDTIETLSSPSSLKGIFHKHRDGEPLPSEEVLREIIGLSRTILYPGYFGIDTVNTRTIKYHIGVRVEKLYNLLIDQIQAGLCFADDSSEEPASDQECYSHRHEAEQKATEFIEKLPEIRRLLATDVVAAYNGDPAATSPAEILSCYPVIKALSNYRIAHELYKLGVPLIPRMITEEAHSETGIDIHPAAQIGEFFTIDHGTGVVIGATCIIGDNVKLYQGVTLGAKSFPLDKKGNPIKGIPRHPIIGDNVVIYANATILGKIKIGNNCVVGANVWVTKDMKPNTRKYKKDKIDNIDLEFYNGTGI